MRTPTITVSPARIAFALGSAVVVLAVASLFAPVLWFGFGHDHVRGLSPLMQSLFDLNSEANVPTWFSSSALLVASLLLAAVGFVERARGRRDVGYWLVLSGIFLFISVDEVARLHERTTVPLREALGAGGVLYYSWVILGGAFVLALAVAYWPFLRRLPSRTRILFVTAAVLFVGGALGVELIAGYYRDLIGPSYRDGLLEVALSNLEEVMEMLGVVVFVFGLLSHLRSQVAEVRITWPGSDAERSPASSRRSRLERPSLSGGADSPGPA
jgi:hypothetical protein